MNDTYCHTFLNSLNSANLTQSLVSKLKERLGTDGSMIYKQQWKQKITPSGIVYWAHTASARRTSDNDCTGWLSPRARGDAGGNRWEKGDIRNLEDQAMISGWPTPRLKESPNRDIDNCLKKGSQMGLSEVVRMASNGFIAETTNTGQLNPAFSRWLMEFPKSWCEAAIRAYRSIQTRRKKLASCD